MITTVLSVFGVTELTVRPHIPSPIYLYHPVRMTDGGFRDTYTIRTDWYFFVFSGTKPIRTDKDDGWGGWTIYTIRSE